jgi:predicted Fe-Mo cluster-binding NifX family protein
MDVHPANIASGRFYRLLTVATLRLLPADTITSGSIKSLANRGFPYFIFILLCFGTYPAFIYWQLKYERRSWMKIALASWNGRIAPVFDVSRMILVMETHHKNILCQKEVMLPQDDLFAKVAQLVNLDIDTLVCGAISRPLAGRVTAHGIHLIPFVAGDIHDVIEACLDHALPHPSFAMPGCRGRHRHPASNTGHEWRRQKRCEYPRERRNIMPRGDGTGPRGQGPGTGLGQGSCGTSKPGRGQAQGGGKGLNNDSGNGSGGGRGTGRGRGRNNR